MSTPTVSICEFSSAGAKAVNQDVVGYQIPEDAGTNKGIACAIADGISTSDVSHIASHTAVTGFLSDYFAAPQGWSTDTAALRACQTTNTWLYAQTQRSPHRLNKDKGYVCTFTGVILKGRFAYIYHAGDTRLSVLRDGELIQVTQDHSSQHPEHGSVLTKAMGVTYDLAFEVQKLELKTGDCLVLSSDGVHEHVSESDYRSVLTNNSVKNTAAALVNLAKQNDSPDNLTALTIQIQDLPPNSHEDLENLTHILPVPESIQVGDILDEYKILRELGITPRSHVFLAEHLPSKTLVALKKPSAEMSENPIFIDNFLHEEWVGNRLDNPYVIKSVFGDRPRTALYSVTEYFEAQTLEQWMRDNPSPPIHTVRRIIEQIAQGLQAFHQHEMVHRDLRPANILIDDRLTVKVIDLGSTFVSGLTDFHQTQDEHLPPGTAIYSAPEMFLGLPMTRKSDIFSLAVITYQMLSQKLPFGNEVARARTRTMQLKLKYRSLTKGNDSVPSWVDSCLRKALNIDPNKRYGELSEFVYDFTHPNESFEPKFTPLMERNPVLFWKVISAVLFAGLMLALVDL